MTIQRTRELLGQDVVSLSDEQVQELIFSTGMFCEELLSVIANDILTNNNPDVTTNLN